MTYLQILRSYSFLLLIGIGTPLLAAHELTKQANDFYLAKDWEKSVEAYHKITTDEPKNGQAYFRLGVSLRHLKRHKASITALEKAEAHGMPKLWVSVARSVTLEGMGQREAAFAALNDAVENGLPAGVLDQNPSLVSLRAYPEFAEVKKKAERTAYPCKYDEEHQQFDFWIGEWDVFGPGGAKVGSNIIEKKVSDCALFENWTNSFGNTGKSLNYYDRTKKRWIQVWIDSGGRVTEYAGSFRDGAMTFLAHDRDAQDRPRVRRMSFTPNADGSVRQLIESSLDDGQTWTTGFDGRYVRQTKKIVAKKP